MEYLKNLMAIIVALALFVTLPIYKHQFSNQWIIKANTKNEKQEFSDMITEQYKKELNLILPEVIDDPSYKIVFSNPSKDKPVNIIIDSREFADVKSPFTLPNLSLGPHSIKIKFTNKEGIPRTLTLTITVVPKEPVINKTNRTLFTTPNPIEIRGKAMAFSKVMAIINGSNVQYINVDPNGNWTFLLKTPKTGVYKFMFFTYNRGIISKKYAYIKVEYKTPTNSIAIVTPTKKPLKERAINFIQDYRKEFVGLAFIMAGLILIIFALKIRAYFKRKWETKEIAELINSNRPKESIDEVVKDLQQNIHQTKNKKKASAAGGNAKDNRLNRHKKATKVTKSAYTKGGKSNNTPKGPKKPRKSTIDKDLTTLVFSSGKTTKPTKKKKKVSSKSQTKKSSKEVTKASQESVTVDRKELSKEEFLGLFKKPEK